MCCCQCGNLTDSQPNAVADNTCWCGNLTGPQPTAAADNDLLVVQASTSVRHLVLPCHWTQRSSIVADMVRSHGCAGRSIIFTDTKKDANELTASLSEVCGVAALHGDIPQVCCHTPPGSAPCPACASALLSEACGASALHGDIDLVPPGGSSSSSLL